jgi:hypothetical protein
MVTTAARSDPLPSSGLTVPQFARRYQVSPDKIRAWIRKGELRAVNVASRRFGRPRLIITPVALAEFERGRQAEVPDAPKARRKRVPKGTIDFLPD